MKLHEQHANWLICIIDEASDSLNEWEENFINSIELKINAGEDLSSKQAEILEKIYNKKVLGL